MTIYPENILYEKMGVISRIFQEQEIFNVSKIVNNFLKEIYTCPTKPINVNTFLNEMCLTIKYNPTFNCNTNAKTDINGEYIILYLPAIRKNYFKIKYTLIHELIHIIQIKTASQKYRTQLDEIRDLLRRQYLSNPEFADDYFMYLLYREDLYEISAWAHNAYLHAFIYRLKYKDCDGKDTKSNNEIAQLIFKNIKLDNVRLTTIINDIKTDDTIFECILSILIGHFSELDGNNGQRFFDNTVFKLPIIQNIRKSVRIILNTYIESEDIVENIISLIDEYKHKFGKDKNIIINSFIQHLTYWYDKAKKQYTKAIQLGIDDANDQKILKYTPIELIDFSEY